MSYTNAMTCFLQNVNLLDRQADPINWNLNNGLWNLSRAIQIDLRQTQQTLNLILQTENKIARLLRR